MWLWTAAFSIALVLGFFLPAATASAQRFEDKVPAIDGDWWRVAGNPDLGEFTSPDQQPVDFGVWQAADGTWQLWSCIRSTKCGGRTRLFHGWEGARLTDPDWTPKGIVMTADPALGETPGGLQAPYVVRHEGRYWLAYGDWNSICFAVSEDGKQFERVVGADGATAVFSEGEGANTRDAMLFKYGDTWLCYYTASPRFTGQAYCRMSPDLRTWGPSCVVAYGGMPGTDFDAAECAHVVEPEPGVYYFFRNRYYTGHQLNYVYRSQNPLNFGIDTDIHLVRTLPIAAPEIIRHEDNWYIAALESGLDGIRIARLKWVPKKEIYRPVFDFDDPDHRARWRLAAGTIPAVFRSGGKEEPFNAPTDHFIDTAAKDGGRTDELTGVIESPAFTMEHGEYVFLVGGRRLPDHLRVELVDKSRGEVLATLTGHNSEYLHDFPVPAAAWRGRDVFVRIVDEFTGPGGHLNFGGVYAVAEP